MFVANRMWSIETLAMQGYNSNKQHSRCGHNGLKNHPCIYTYGCKFKESSRLAQHCGLLTIIAAIKFGIYRISVGLLLCIYICAYIYIYIYINHIIQVQMITCS